MPVPIYLPYGCGPARAGRASPKAEARAIAGPGAAQRRRLYFLGPPKSAAGRRQVVFPDVIVPDLREHLAQYSQPEGEGLVFTSPGGVQLRQSNFRRRVWAPALAEAGLPGVRFHDLRHTGNTLTAGAGANLRELMERMGHSSAGAAMIYLHATGERQRMIADALGDLARMELASGQKPRRGGKASGTDLARRRRQPSS